MRSSCRRLAQHIAPHGGSRALHAAAAQQSCEAPTLSSALPLAACTSSAAAAAAVPPVSSFPRSVAGSFAAGVGGAIDYLQSLWLAVPKKKVGCFTTCRWRCLPVWPHPATSAACCFLSPSSSRSCLYALQSISGTEYILYQEHTHEMKSSGTKSHSEAAL